MSDPSTPPRPVVVRPGQKVPDSGIYEARVPNGDGTFGEPLQEATCVRGDTAPPVIQPSAVWVQKVDTNPDDPSSQRLRGAE